MSHVPWMAMETSNVDTIYSLLYFLEQKFGGTQKDGIWTGRDPSSNCLTSIVNGEETNVPLEMQFSLYKHQDVTEMSSIIQETILSDMHCASFSECQNALDQILLPIQSISWAVFTIMSPEYATIKLRNQMFFCRIEHGWAKVHTKLDYIQIRDLRFGTCTTHIVEEAYRLLQKGGRLDHITFDFLLQENSSLKPKEWAWDQLRPALHYSAPVKVGFQFIKTKSYPLNLHQLHTKELVARSQNDELLNKGHLLASFIKDACEKKEMVVSAECNFYVKPEATAVLLSQKVSDNTLE